jgi:hypothetical protein
MKLDDIIKKAKLVITSKTIYSKVEEEDQELRHWDAFGVLIEKIEQEYIAEKKYSGLPALNECWILLREIYKDADEHEREMIFGFMISLWDSLFRHWKIDMDERWGKGEWNKYF